MQEEYVHLLLASTRANALEEVAREVAQTTGMICKLWHCTAIDECLEFIKDNELHIDIVLLDLELVASSGTESVFQQIWHSLKDTPVIIFTKKEDHKLALIVMEQGASDNVVISKDFEMEGDRLRDAIEFAWIRNRRTKRRKADFQMEHDMGDISRREERQKSSLAMEELNQIIRWMGGGYSVDTAQH